MKKDANFEKSRPLCDKSNLGVHSFIAPYQCTIVLFVNQLLLPLLLLPLLRER